uniref:Uncharacterized protein n=1 Tax=Arion vulgaris TaxID=1028688 RepID=A0A0B6Y3F1_9EUPU
MSSMVYIALKPQTKHAKILQTVLHSSEEDRNQGFDRKVFIEFSLRKKESVTVNK